MTDQPGMAEPVPVPERLVQKVLVPPKTSLAKELRSVVRETFFHNVRDGSWFPAAGVSRRRQGLEALKCVLPIVDWLCTYSMRFFFHDLLAGLTTTGLAIPQVVHLESSTHRGHNCSSHVHLLRLLPANVFSSIFYYSRTYSNVNWLTFKLFVTLLPSLNDVLIFWFSFVFCNLMFYIVLVFFGNSAIDLPTIFYIFFTT